MKETQKTFNCNKQTTEKCLDIWKSSGLDFYPQLLVDVHLNQNTELAALVSITLTNKLFADAFCEGIL